MPNFSQIILEIIAINYIKIKKTLPQIAETEIWKRILTFYGHRIRIESNQFIYSFWPYFSLIFVNTETARKVKKSNQFNCILKYIHSNLFICIRNSI